MGYRVVRQLARALLGPFYHRVEVVGRERVTLLPAGFFALAWRERLDRVRREARAFLGFLADRDLRGRLLARRRALVDELAAPAGLGPESVGAGEGRQA